jgi:Tfp pilus assembly protein PilX
MKENQKGISLVITLFIMTIILGVVLSVSSLLYSQLKMIRNIGNSVISFYAAESGIEKVLYYDKQLRKLSGTDCESDSNCTSGYICSIAGKCITQRGLCSMVANSGEKNCPNVSGRPGLDSSAYCEKQSVNLFINGNDCNSVTCSDCTISFKTNFDNREYFVSANVIPGKFLNIRSNGVFGGVGRQIEASQLAGYNQ